MKKIIALIVAVVMIAVLFVTCSAEASGTRQDTLNQQQAANRLQSNQSTPMDIDYSLERYNLIRRAYWVNGQREKANTLPCAVEKPLGYIVLFTESGAVVGSFDIKIMEMHNGRDEDL